MPLQSARGYAWRTAAREKLPGIMKRERHDSAIRLALPKIDFGWAVASVKAGREASAPHRQVAGRGGA